MVSFLVKRLVLAVVTIYIVITLTFFMIRLMPGNAMSYLQSQLSAQGGLTTQQIATRVQEAYGIQTTNALWQQYLSYVGNAFRFNFGTSIINPGQTVLSVVAGALPWTLLIVGLALLISFVIGVVVGTLIAAYPQSLLSKIATGVVSFLAAVPNYVVALVLIYVIADRDHLLPSSGPYSLTTTPGWNPAFIGSVLQHAILPVLSYVIVAFGSWALTMKGSVSTILGADYVRTGEAWGLSRWRVTRSYIGRNAMLPMVTNLGLSLGYMFGGSVFIETFFVYPGLGYYLIQSVNERDYPVMMGCFILITVAVVLSNLIVDLVYPLVDPRIMSPGRAKRAGLTVSGLAAENQTPDPLERSAA
ncbi:MAG TPA: ABC transporter permease [Trebonia sp.]|jgi:peptide/nickel transport system permease protein|nr:ABC transporter permease [Trebonia sp.]